MTTLAPESLSLAPTGSTPDSTWTHVGLPDSRTPQSQDAAASAAQQGADFKGHQCALCSLAQPRSQLHFGVMGSFAYCTGCLLKVGAAYANGSSLAETALTNFSAPSMQPQSAAPNVRTCGTCYGSKAISDFLRPDNGSVSLERECNECAVAAASQLHSWQAMQQSSFQQQTSAALLAQLSTMLHSRLHPGLHPPLPLHIQQAQLAQQQAQAQSQQVLLQPQRQYSSGVIQPMARALLSVVRPVPSVPLAASAPQISQPASSQPQAQHRQRSPSSSASDEEYLPPPMRAGVGGVSSTAPPRPNSGRTAQRLGPKAVPMKASAAAGGGGGPKTKKMCSRCRQEKPASCYNLDRGKPDGLYCHCRACCAEMNAVRNQKKALVTTPTVDAKMCTKCRQHKKALEFYRQNTSQDGLRSWCKACYRTFPKKKVQ